MSTAKWLSIIAALSFIFTLTMNSLSNTGTLGDGTIATVSAKYSNLFTPAGYAFSIWGLIYLAMIVFTVIQIQWAWSSSDWVGANQLRILFIASNFLNAFWLVAWLNEQLGGALLIMLGLLLVLVSLMVITNQGPERFGSWSVRYPFQLYAGWITVAIIANTSAYLIQIDFSWALSEEAWTMVMLVAALLIYSFVLWNQNAAVYAAVGIWATSAIAYKQWEANPSVAYTAICVAIVLMLLILIKVFR